MASFYYYCLLITVFFVFASLYQPVSARKSADLNLIDKPIGYTVHDNASVLYFTHNGFTHPYPCAFEWMNTSKAFEPKCLKWFSQSVISLQEQFYSPKYTSTDKYHSEAQAKQDIIILTMLDDLEYGYYVDLAANDWIYGSNTYILEELNHWDGICIEPHPKYLPGLLANRRCKVFTNPVMSKMGAELKFRFTGKNGMFSGVVGNEMDNKPTDNKANEGDVETFLHAATLSSILEHAKAPRVIHYLSLDVEGAELSAMQSLDFHNYIFLIMTIERPSHDLHRLLVKNGYIVVFMAADWGDMVYVHHTIPKLESIMNRYHRNSTYSWGDVPHLYFDQPRWTGSYKAPQLHHHHNSNKHNNGTAPPLSQ